MGIVFSLATNSFHLQSRETSMVLQIVRGRYLSSRYWGPRLESWNDSCGLSFVDRPFAPNPFADDRAFSLDTLPQEYPAYGNTDFRSPAFQVRSELGSSLCDLGYASHVVFDGKPSLEGLPSLMIEPEDGAQTLEITLFDTVISLEVILVYTVIPSLDLITRSVRFRNRGTGNLTILRAMSASIDFEHSNFELLQLPGAWGRERHLFRSPLHPGLQGFGSARGASSHQHNPFLALVTPGTDEERGEVRAMNLVYSGNFLAQAEVDQFGGTRVTLGINPFEFSWGLAPGSRFQTPEAVLVFSHRGLGGMSLKFHRAYRTRLCRGPWRDRPRPVLINNWEATYFDFNETKILALAEEAQALGIELLVLDDGWFGHRDNDKTSLGDWVVDRSKLPGGLEALVRGVHARGLEFGLWFEPEMVSPDSELYRAHPDWCLHVADRPRSQGRNQLVLDLGRPEVRSHLIESLGSILRSVPIRYVKWDMNRHQTEVGSAVLGPEAQKETSHRYILGLYEVLSAITASFPEVLFESCSGGGGRFDPGILAFMPQTWTSDNTDAVSRLKIQYGTSLVYPPVTMGSHVSAVPNHQVGRTTPLSFRGAVAMGGNLGYELDVGKLSPEEKDEVRRQVATYRDLRELVQRGDFYRLANPFLSSVAAWIFVSADGSKAWASWFQTSGEANQPVPSLRLRGLEPHAKYRLDGTDRVFGGDELMLVGLRVSGPGGDHLSCSWVLNRVE